MLALDDPKWQSLQGGYRLPYDPTAALRRLFAGEDREEIWAELWEELHHQGDVGVASYACVPHLVQVQMGRDNPSWNLYALIAVIEIERKRNANPPVPDWLLPDYEAAWRNLLPLALRDYPKANDATTSRAILGVLALCKGLRETGTIISYFNDSEIKEIFDRQ